MAAEGPTWVPHAACTCHRVAATRFSAIANTSFSSSRKPSTRLRVAKSKTTSILLPGSGAIERILSSLEALRARNRKITACVVPRWKSQPSANDGLPGVNGQMPLLIDQSDGSGMLRCHTRAP